MSVPFLLGVCPSLTIIPQIIPKSLYRIINSFRPLFKNLRAEIKPILEDIPGIKKTLDGVFEQVGKNTEILGILETAVGKNGKKLASLEILAGKNAEGIRANAEGIELNQQLITRVLEELKSKVDRKDFETLEKKVTSLTT